MLRSGFSYLYPFRFSICSSEFRMIARLLIQETCTLLSITGKVQIYSRKNVGLLMRRSLRMEMAGAHSIPILA
jgi:hypothetical protein